MAIICPTCKTSYADGTLFCDQCGNWLISVAPQTAGARGAQQTTADSPTLPQTLRSAAPSSFAQTDSPLNTVESAAEPPLPWLSPLDKWAPPTDPDTPGTLPLPKRADGEKASSASNGPSKLRVLVLNTGRLSEWIDDPVIQVGRTDRSVNVFPQLDLEVDGGHNAGVSRRHVRIHRQPDGYFVEDLGSVNGTFLNRRRLSPGGTAELRDGDELRVGNVVLRVQLGGYSPHS